MRDAGQAEFLAQLGEVVQQLGDAAVVGLEEGLQGQAGEQLVLGKVLAGELRRVRGQGLLGQPQGLLQEEGSEPLFLRSRPAA